MMNDRVKRSIDLTRSLFFPMCEMYPQSAMWWTTFLSIVNHRNSLSQIACGLPKLSKEIWAKYRTGLGFPYFFEKLHYTPMFALSHPISGTIVKFLNSFSHPTRWPNIFFLSLDPWFLFDFFSTAEREQEHHAVLDQTQRERDELEGSGESVTPICTHGNLLRSIQVVHSWICVGIIFSAFHF